VVTALMLAANNNNLDIIIIREILEYDAEVNVYEKKKCFGQAFCLYGNQA
jgi:hypothetical protein